MWLRLPLPLLLSCGGCPPLAAFMALCKKIANAKQKPNNAQQTKDTLEKYMYL